MANTTKTFPGVYTQITDQSFFTPATSNFKPGLIGVAAKGPFNTPTPIASLQDFINKFGTPLLTQYTTDSSTSLQAPVNAGYFLADAVDAIADLTDGTVVVRIGNQYVDFPTPDGITSGTTGIGSYSLKSSASYGRVKALLDNNAGVAYLRVAQAGKKSSVNMLVVAAGMDSTLSGTITFDPSGLPLQAKYDAATISYDESGLGLAANAAEGILRAYSYGATANDLTDSAVSALGTVSGHKNQFQFVATAGADIEVGSVYKIMESGKPTTHEVRVTGVLTNSVDSYGTVSIATTSNQQVGWQATPLQANYVAATLYKATGAFDFAYLAAESAGEWANGGDSSQGLFLKVRPGSNPGSKKLEIYWNSALVETQDNLSDDKTDTVNHWNVRLAQGVSNYVYLKQDVTVNSGADYPTAANTVAPWDSRFYNNPSGVANMPAMPVGAINAGLLALTAGADATDTGGQFAGGYNGENPTDADWIGTLDPVTDKLSGIRAFENTRALAVNVVAAPMHNINLAVMTQLATTNGRINGFSPVDVPAALNARQAIDWHNGNLPQQHGRLDNHTVGCYWNWFQRTNNWGETKLVPPTIGWLRAAAYTFSTYAPWYAIAGLNRGALSQATAVQFAAVSEDTLQAMYGNGNSVNPILVINGSFYLYGERTMQRAESKLTAVHSVICANWAVNALANVARRFVFDPNDQELLDSLDLAFHEQLDAIKNGEGLEDYGLTVTASASDRNQRQAICNLWLIPTDCVDRIYINATVLQSGAAVNSIS